MADKRAKSAPKMRELFVDELADVRGGSTGGGPLADPCCTTHACCEEGPFDGCCDLGLEITD